MKWKQSRLDFPTVSGIGRTHPFLRETAFCMDRGRADMQERLLKGQVRGAKQPCALAMGYDRFARPVGHPA